MHIYFLEGAEYIALQSTQKNRHSHSKMKNLLKLLRSESRLTGKAWPSFINEPTEWTIVTVKIRDTMRLIQCGHIGKTNTESSVTPKGHLWGSTRRFAFK